MSTAEANSRVHMDKRGRNAKCCTRSMNLNIVLLLGLLLILCPGHFGDAAEQCDKSNPCHCIFGDKFINLEPLSFTNSSARFSAGFHPVIDTGDDTYTLWYNPCKVFTLGKGECQDVAACLEIGLNIMTIQESFGEQEDVQWTLRSDDVPKIRYKYKEKTLDIRLICDNSVTVESSALRVENITSTSVTANLTSVCACPNGCPLGNDPGTNDDSGLSPGSIFVIMFFVLLIGYLLGGIIYKKVALGATGKEVIPNIEFWTEFPKLVLDGIAFTCNCCRKRQSTPGYDDV